MVINWCAIKAKEEDIKDTIIKKSLSLINLLLRFISLITIKIKISKKKWINLKRKTTLLNSNGKRKSNLFSPIDKGNWIYCSKKANNGIFVIYKVIKKIKIIVMDPNIRRMMLFNSKLM